MSFFTWFSFLKLFLTYIVDVSSSVQPVPRNTMPTRYSNNKQNKVTKYNIPRCKISTYQKTFTVRTVRIWNSLADELNFNTTVLSRFKTAMLNYYFCPRTFKSTCLKCNTARSLSDPTSCCQ